MGLSERHFNQICQFIYSQVGIKCSLKKKPMIESRLAKRLRALNLADYGNYCEYLFSEEGLDKELVHLINVVTTNKTDFLREASHFKFLTETVLPELRQQRRLGPKKKLNLWSAGCSTGEEPYTLAMVLDDFNDRQEQDKVPFEILATDVSTRVLKIAREAVYHEERVEPIPLAWRKRYLLRSRDPDNPLVRIAPELRKKVVFGRLNFMDDEFGLPNPMDIIFCRNVIIYFDRPTQERLMRKFAHNLVPGGSLFIGHSESLHGFDIPFEQVTPTVYRRVS